MERLYRSREERVSAHTHINSVIGSLLTKLKLPRIGRFAVEIETPNQLKDFHGKNEYSSRTERRKR